jgi:hypothetical protein
MVSFRMIGSSLGTLLADATGLSRGASRFAAKIAPKNLLRS